MLDIFQRVADLDGLWAILLGYQVQVQIKFIATQ